MDTQHVDPNTIPVWRWQALLTCFLLSWPLIVIAIRTDEPWRAVPFAVFVIVASVLAWRLPRAYYTALRFGVDEYGITIHRGIFWRSHISLPRIRVQHSDVSQGPLQRRYGVATLKLYTAGSRYTKIELPGLEHEEAVSLRDALIARGGDSGV